MVYVSSKICASQVFKDLSGPNSMRLVKVLGWISENWARDKVPASVMASDLGLDSGIVEELCNTDCLQLVRSSAGCFYRVAGLVTGVITWVPRGAGVREFWYGNPGVCIVSFPCARRVGCLGGCRVARHASYLGSVGGPFWPYWSRGDNVVGRPGGWLIGEVNFTVYGDSGRPWCCQVDEG